MNEGKTLGSIDDQILRTLKILPGSTILDALVAMEQGEMGIVFVCDEKDTVLGSLTDGDIRRAIIGGVQLGESKLLEVMNRDFVSVTPRSQRADVLDLMLARQIEQIPILDGDGRFIGLHTMRNILGGAVRPNWAVIMAGGKGTRLRPYTENTPKPMVKVAGRPMLERLVLQLVGHGIRQVFISVNYLAEKIEEHFGDGSEFGCSIRYLREDHPLGTAGALSLLPETPEDPFLVMNGDLVTQANLASFLDFHSGQGFSGTMGVRAHPVTVPYGVAEVSGARLVEIREKPTQEFLVNAGLYVLSPGVLQYVEADGEFPMTDLFNRCIQQALPVGVYVLTEDWMDVGRPDDLVRAHGGLV